MDEQEKDALSNRVAYLSSTLWDKRHKTNKTEDEIREILGILSELCEIDARLGNYGIVERHLKDI